VGDRLIGDLGGDLHGGAGVSVAVAGDVLIANDDRTKGVGDNAPAKGGGGGDLLISIGNSSAARRMPTLTLSLQPHRDWIGTSTEALGRERELGSSAGGTHDGQQCQRH
jgi:hypothetical protein